MKGVQPFLFGGIVLTMLVSLVICLGGFNSFFGVRNTIYSSSHTVEQYPQVADGMSRAKVIDLLGEPLEQHSYTNITNLPIDVLYFSRARRTTEDYDEIRISIGPDNKVIQHERWITD